MKKDSQKKVKPIKKKHPIIEGLPSIIIFAGLMILAILSFNAEMNSF